MKSSKITYTISLHFPQKVNEIIISTVEAISDLTGNHFITENKIPPHITIGAFHAAKDEESKLLQLVEDFAKKMEPGIIHFCDIGNFNNKVLFLKPEKDDFLAKINADLHSILLPKFEKAENGYYLPEIWFPHTTLATRLNQSQFEKAKEIAGKIKLPLEAEISEISVYQRSPLEELKRLTIRQPLSGSFFQSQKAL